MINGRTGCSINKIRTSATAPDAHWIVSSFYDSVPAGFFGARKNYQLRHARGGAAIETQKNSSVYGEELYRRYVAGDGEAFDALVALFEDELARFINGIVSDHHESKHLTIEAFARLALKGRKFSGRASLKTYLFSIGKNLALRYVKMRGRERHIPYDDLFDVPGDDEDAPHSIVLRDESERLLREAMSGLKEDHRAVLTLLYFEDMSYLQAGRAMKRTETQISGLAHRAKAALKKTLVNSGYARN